MVEFSLLEYILHHQWLPSLALFPSLQGGKYISRYFHFYDFMAKLHIFPIKNVTFCTFLIFIILKREILTNLLTSDKHLITLFQLFYAMPSSSISKMSAEPPETATAAVKLLAVLQPSGNFLL